MRALMKAGFPELSGAGLFVAGRHVVNLWLAFCQRRRKLSDAH